MKITVKKVDCRKYKNVAYYRSDRKSPLGNPYIVGKDGNRSQCILKFMRLFNDSAKGLPMREHVRKIVARAIQGNFKELCFTCHCAPDTCHSDVIALYAKNVYGCLTYTPAF